MGAASSFDSTDAIGGESLIAEEKLLILTRENIVGRYCDIIASAETAAECECEGRLARSDWAGARKLEKNENIGPSETYPPIPTVKPRSWKFR